MNPLWIDIAVALGVTLVAGGLLLSLPPGLIFGERRICAWMQDRCGPNRVGPQGLLQPIADGIKLIFKEDMRPSGADRYLYTAGPALTFVPAFIAFAAIPFGNQITIGEETYRLQVGDLNVGILFLLAIGSVGVYGISFGGWASNNKYSLMGSLRAAAQLISYELAMGLSLITMIMIAGTLSLQEFVRIQAEEGWFLFNPQHWTATVAFVIFFVSAFAETNRAPFDMPEAEPELIGGYHTEYSSMRWAMFFFGEYLAMVVMSGLTVTLFLGGWHFPGLTDPDGTGILDAVLSFAVFMVKLLTILFIFIWVRWTLPRFRYDQLMGLGWKIMIPLALVTILVTGVWNVAVQS